MNLILVGFGVVGQGLAEILRDKGDLLQSQYGFEARIVGVATRSRGTLYRPGVALDIPALLDAMQKGGLQHYPDTLGLQRNLDVEEMLSRQGEADVLIETSYTNLETAQPALDYCLTAFASGKHVVLANKGPVALHYRQLRKAAQAAGKLLRFEATVMAGTPTLRLGMQALAGCEIREARGILNGTTNYILTQMENGMTYADALAQAQQLGYAEADPAGDVDGWDAAGKALILAAALFGSELTMADMDVKGISQITPDDIEAARAASERWKLIARVTPEGGSVQPTRVPVSSPLAGVSGATNAVTFVTDLMGEVTLVGPGAGRLQTGFALLSDLLDIHRLTSSEVQ